MLSDSTTRERQEQQHDIFSKTHILRFTDYVHGEVQGDRHYVHSERKAMHRWVGAGLCSILPLHLPRRNLRQSSEHHLKLGPSPMAWRRAEYLTKASRLDVQRR